MNTCAYAHKTQWVKKGKCKVYVVRSDMMFIMSVFFDLKNHPNAYTTKNLYRKEVSARVRLLTENDEDACIRIKLYLPTCFNEEKKNRDAYLFFNYKNLILTKLYRREREGIAPYRSQISIVF